MGNKYSVEELQALLEKAEYYDTLEKKGRLLILPCQLDSTIYRVVKDVNNKWKVMQGVFTMDLLQEYGKNVFGTEPEAVIAAASRE